MTSSYRPWQIQYVKSIKNSSKRTNKSWKLETVFSNINSRVEYLNVYGRLIARVFSGLYMLEPSPQLIDSCCIIQDLNPYRYTYIV
jgi:hypothetical protein